MHDDERQILTKLEAFKRAVAAKDKAAYLALYADSARIFDFWEQWSYDSATSWAAMVDGWFGSLQELRDEVNFSDVRVTVSGHLALVHGFVRFSAIAADDREVRGMDERLTIGLEKLNGEWKIVHQHTSAPIQGQTMQPNLQRKFD